MNQNTERVLRTAFDDYAQDVDEAFVAENKMGVIYDDAGISFPVVKMSDGAVGIVFVGEDGIGLMDDGMWVGIPDQSLIASVIQ